MTSAAQLELLPTPPLTLECVMARLELDGVPRSTISKFKDYYCHNVEAWKLFERYSLEAIASGKRLGAKAVMERVRWEAEIIRQKTCKINNSYTAYFARVFGYKYPRHQNYFEFRQINGLGVLGSEA